MPNNISQHPCIIQSIHNLCSKNQIKEAIQFLPLLYQKGIRLNSNTISLLLKKCANLKLLKQGKWVHTHLSITGLKHPGLLVSNNLIYFYAKCGDFIEARKVFDTMTIRNLYSWNSVLFAYGNLGMCKPAKRIFDKMVEKDIVSWNTMVIMYAKKGEKYASLRFFKEFRRSGIGVNEFSFSGVLTVCVKYKDLGLVKQVHCEVLVMGFSSNVVILSSIIDCYARCGDLVDGRRLFDEMSFRDVLAWTTLVSGYAQWGDMKSAEEIFSLMVEKNSVSWTAMISGYARNDMGCKALDLFRKMMFCSLRPDQFTFSSCLCACASLASLKHGKQIHGYLLRIGFKPNTIVVSSLIDMYSRCGHLTFGHWVFNATGNKQDPVLWNTMISALSQHGRCDEAMMLFSDMVKLGVKPDRITFIVIISACSHSGNVEEGLEYFNSMSSGFGIVPDQEHYAYLVDLLGRAGCFEELIHQLGKIPCMPDKFVWNALLGVCKIHGNLGFVIQAAEKLIEMDPQSSAAYMVLSSIYASLGRWEAVEKVRRLMDDRDVKKEWAISWVDGK